MNDVRNIHLTYDIESRAHRDAESEWQPHNVLSDKFLEWHYWTCAMEGTNGHRYFLFLLDMNFSSPSYTKAVESFAPGFVAPKDKNLFGFMTILADYTSGEVVSEFDISIQDPKEIFDYKTNTKLFRGKQYSVDMTYSGGNVAIKARGPKFEVELSATGGNRVMWAQDKLGAHGFIQQGAKDDFSFYYSLPDLPFHGTLKQQTKGEWAQTEVTGRGWIDRQWGDFLNKTWEWASFRFADGDRINLYNFEGGHKVGTYQKADGSCEYFDNFTVYQTGYSKTPDNIWFSYGWEYDLPVKGRRYTCQPLSSKSTMIAAGNSFYEGMGRLLDEAGNQVGWSVNESMDVRLMENAPGGKFQHNRH
jgi:hypothetical protein